MDLARVTDCWCAKMSKHFLYIILGYKIKNSTQWEIFTENDKKKKAICKEMRRVNME